MNQDKKTKVIFSILGIIPVIWLGLIIAPLTEGGLTKILSEFSSAISSPFNITICENSKKTILLFLLAYGIGIGLYFSNIKNYRRGKEHGSAQWGIAKMINQKYKQTPESENRVLTQNIRLGLNAKKHRRNLNTIVVGGSRSR